MELLKAAPTESGFKDDHVGRLNEPLLVALNKHDKK